MVPETPNLRFEVLGVEHTAGLKGLLGAEEQAELDAWIEQQRDNFESWQFGHYGVFDKNDGRLVGYAGLEWLMVNGHKRIGINGKFHPKYQAWGYGKEALDVICQRGFVTLGISALYFLKPLGNEEWLPEALAMNYEGEARGDDGQMCEIYVKHKYQ